MTTVGLVKGNDRYENVLQALKNAGPEAAAKVRDRVLIKVNTVMGAGEGVLANSQPDAIRAVLEYLQPLPTTQIWVGEASVHPMELFKENDYFQLKDRYAFDFVDLNDLGYDDLELIDIQGRPLAARISRAYRMVDCLISLSVPKAHSDVLITLSAKNMMGFVKENNDKIWHIHGVEEFGRDDNLAACTHTIHKNIRALLKRVRPDIAVLDAFHSFEGGRVPQCADGDYVEPRFAVAGIDFVAVDTLTTHLLGFNPQDVGYLMYAAQDGYGTMDLSQMEVVGTAPEEARFPLKPPPRADRLILWRDEAVGMG